MRNGLVQLGAWAAATGAAVALSWFGVHAVLVGTVFEQPKAVPLPSTGPAVRPSGLTAAPPSPAATGPASGSPSPSRSAAATPTATGGPTRRPSPAASLSSYLVPGGRVALDLRPDSAELVSATPDSGWQMQVWHGDQWMRIDFSSASGTSSVFVTWNGHPPTVQTVPAA